MPYSDYSRLDKNLLGFHSITRKNVDGKMDIRKREQWFRYYKYKDLDPFDIKCLIPQFIVYYQSSLCCGTVDIQKNIHPKSNEYVHKNFIVKPY